MDGTPEATSLSISVSTDEKLGRPDSRLFCAFAKELAIDRNEHSAETILAIIAALDSREDKDRRLISEPPGWARMALEGK